MKSLVLTFLIVALAEGFVDRGRGAPCVVAGTSMPGYLFAGTVLLILVTLSAMCPG